MCENCEEKAREQVEEAIRLLGHDMSLIDPILRQDLMDNEHDHENVDNFFIQVAIARLACALSIRTGAPPFIVMGEIAGTMMHAHMETERLHEIMNYTGQNLN